MGRRTLLLVAAFVVAALGTTLVFLYVNGVNDRALADQKPQRVLVAKEDIPAGTTGRDIEANVLVEPKSLSRSGVLSDAIGSVAAIEGQVAVTPIFKGEQIIQRKFGDSTQSSSLVVPPGKIAVSVPGGGNNQLGAFLTPGSNVAVFVTTGGAGGASRTRVLLSSVQVIANGSQTLTSSPDAAAGANGQLTLAVTQGQAQLLISASQGGTLSFALLTDTSKIDPSDPGSSLNQIAP